jgi:integrase
MRARGHVRWKGNSCEISIPVPGEHTAKGAQRYHYEYFHKGEDETVTAVETRAKARLAELQLKLYRGEPLQTYTAKFGDFLDEWVKKSVEVRADYKPKTRRWYIANVENHLKAADFAKKRVCEVTPFDLNNLYKQKAEKLSAKTIRGIHATVSAAFSWGKSEMLLTRNPAEDAKPPKIRKGTYRTLQPEEIPVLLKTNEGYPIHGIICTFLYAALRNSELRGLREWDVDLDRMQLRVANQVGEGSSYRPVWEETKTPDSDGVIPIVPPLAKVLKKALADRDRDRALMEEAGKEYREHHLVFANLDGRPLVMSTLNREFKAALKRAGLPETMHPHLLRHSTATILLELGVDPFTISAILRHSDVSITRIYTHPKLGTSREALTKLDALITKTPKNPPKKAKEKTSSKAGL